MPVADQVQYESGVRFRYAVIACVAAALVVAAQAIQLTGVHAAVNELTLDLIAASQRATLDIVGAALDMLGLISVGVLLYWLHRVTAARRQLRPIVRWISSIGAGLTAIMAIVYTVIVANRAQEFVASGNQSYPEANRLTGTGLIVALPILLELGTLLLAIGCIWISLSAMRVGLFTRLVGYAGVVAGALFLFPIGVFVPIIQGFWLAAVAITLARRWPSGDPPAWDSGVAVPWEPTQAAHDRQAARSARQARGQRRRVSDREVLAAVDEGQPKPANPQAGKRKRKRK